MKRFLLILAVVAAAAGVTSCLQGSSKYSYTLYSSFEYQQIVGDNSFFEGKSYYGKQDFLYDVVRYNGVREGEDSTLVGGFAICYKKDSVIVDRTEPVDPFTMYENNKLFYNVENHFIVYRQNDDTSKNPVAAIRFVYFGQTGCSCVPNRFYIANTTESFMALSAMEGEVKADVTFTGYSNSTATASVKASLLKEGKPLTTWETVDVSTLGDVEYITISIESTDNAVKAFALDNLLYNITME